ncbi:hypothetical protein GWK47_050322 [Chionoecetes opilio]|uniref:Uncharacterized protein n=1 Tax=Chionoecetes opilio TaxID=41210 RepID=A0A8J5CSV9_CHIOP|nr:hypothetical protein GWK47_050322 [Chionoecetes opilio]
MRRERVLRDVAACASVQNPSRQGAPTLAISGKPWATPNPYSTLGTPTRGTKQLIVPFARTDFFRSFLPRYSRLGNRVVRKTDHAPGRHPPHLPSVPGNAWTQPTTHAVLPPFSTHPPTPHASPPLTFAPPCPASGVPPPRF